jgi:GntR family transcriptional regulator/MocR family aminotransferase
VRDLYRARRDALVQEVATVFGPDRLQGLAAGCHTVLLLPLEVDEDAVVKSARSMGVRVTGLRRYRLTHTSPEPALVLAFGNLSEHQLIRGVHAIAEAVRRCQADRPLAGGQREAGTTADRHARDVRGA